MKHILGKRELNKARKRAEIVEIAKRSFFEHGYAGTAMSAIAEELGGSKATLWAHFGSKEELFAAVIDQQIESFSKDLEDVLAGQIFSLPALRRLCLRYLERLLCESAVRLYALALSEGVRFPEVAEMFYSRAPKRAREFVVDFYATRLPPPAAVQLTRLTLAALSGYRSDILLRPRQTSQAEREIFVDGLVELIAAWIDKHARNGGICCS